MDFLLILLTVFGIILLITLIVLCVRLNFTLNKVDNLLTDLTKKMETVNNVFDVVNKVSNSVSIVNDRFFDMAISFIANLFSKRKKKNNEEEF